MKRTFALLALTLLLLVGCQTAPRDTITQVATINALLAGGYDGHLSLGELAQAGDFGIGTFQGLDGEMIMLDGVCWQIRADGKGYRPGPTVTTPFAAVTTFAEDTAFTCTEATPMVRLQALVDRAAPNQNLFCAVRVDGEFARMKTRSVPAQQRPYRPLVEITASQPIFELENVRGMIVGFRCPSFVAGVNVPGYHLHFIAEDGSAGGHILDFELTRGNVALDICHRLTLILPTADGDFAQMDLGKDRSRELHEAER